MGTTFAKESRTRAWFSGVMGPSIYLLGVEYRLQRHRRTFRCRFLRCGRDGSISCSDSTPKSVQFLLGTGVGWERPDRAPAILGGALHRFIAWIDLPHWVRMLRKSYSRRACHKRCPTHPPLPASSHPPGPPPVSTTTRRRPPDS